MVKEKTAWVFHCAQTLRREGEGSFSQTLEPVFKVDEDLKSKQIVHCILLKPGRRNERHSTTSWSSCTVFRPQLGPFQLRPMSPIPAYFKIYGHEHVTPTSSLVTVPIGVPQLSRRMAPAIPCGVREDWRPMEWKMLLRYVVAWSRQEYKSRFEVSCITVSLHMFKTNFFYISFQLRSLWCSMLH